MNFNRRDFLQLGAAAVAAAAIPVTIPEFIAHHTMGLSSIRFVRIFDCMQSVMVNRLDALWGPLEPQLDWEEDELGRPIGPQLALPLAVEGGSVLRATTKRGLTKEMVQQWLEEQCRLWIPQGYQKLITEAVGGCVMGKENVVHRSWELTEEWAKPRLVKHG